MENNTSTPPLKFLFKPTEHPEALKLAETMGVKVVFTPDEVYACAYFYSTHDFNEFRASI